MMTALLQYTVPDVSDLNARVIVLGEVVIPALEQRTEMMSPPVAGADRVTTSVLPSTVRRTSTLPPSLANRPHATASMVNAPGAGVGSESET